MKKLLYLINRSIKLYRLDLRLSVSSLITLTTVFFIFNFLFTIGYSANMFFSKLSNVQNIRIYLKTEDKAKIDELIKNLKYLKSVDKLKFYSKEDAYNYLKENTYNLNYLNKVSKNFFPSFIEITLKKNFRDVKFVNQIENEINKFDIVDVASFGEKWILKFASIKYSLQLFILVVIILLSISVAFISINIINLNLYKFKDEIKIYSLVGATRSFIIIPYIFANIIEFIFSFILSLAINLVIFYLLNNAVLSVISIDFIRIPNIIIYVLIALYFFTLTVSASYYSAYKFLDKASKIND